jgi:hypothetical protein
MLILAPNSFLDTSTNAYAYQAIPHVLYQHQYKPTLFFHGKVHQKNEIINKKFKNEIILEVSNQQK